MNEQLSTKLVEVIGSVSEQVGKVSDFAVEQLPDVAQQYIAYGRMAESFYFGISVLFFSIGISSLVIMWHKCHMTDWDEGELVGGWVISLVVSILSFLGIIVNASSFFIVWFAPKVYLLQQLAHLIK